ncbi:putative PurR-regulated permease PerM [Methanofollis sp. W23]|uniref:AI-2E family transporter n=1 Tax=Methanofollis sp. W23 TaxID=2817849 RepID=UPI001AE50D4C|nr:AI-2E family transporter [Methanofollis sp. W23]MBP2145273.1 putative PurR-regulated permease PerM [Methanofollis sp. W23]
MDPPSEISGTLQALAIMASLFVIVIGMRYSAYIVNLLLISVILTILALPAMDMLRKRGLPDLAAMGVISAVAAVVLIVGVVITVSSLETLLADLPTYQADLQMRLADLTALFQDIGIDASAFTPASFHLADVVTFIEPYAIGLGNALMYLFFILITTMFAVLEIPHISERLKRGLVREPKTFVGIEKMSRLMMDFVIVRTEANLIHGVLFGLSLWLMGIHSAVLWGVLTFILAFIPYIGLIIAALPAIFFAWLQYGLWGAAAVVGIVVILNAVVENPIYAKIASRRFEMPPMVVILSLIIWGWILGLPGMIFAVPITLLLVILLQCSDELRWINDLLGVSGIFGEKACKNGPE